tara:strand:- start:559 stop:738 length:180 start_codon:yes stop_codon:yes gene_type:complete
MNDFFLLLFYKKTRNKMEYKVLWSSQFHVKDIGKKTSSNSVENTMTAPSKEEKYDQKNR